MQKSLNSSQQQNSTECVYFCPADNHFDEFVSKCFTATKTRKGPQNAIKNKEFYLFIT